MQRCSVWGLIGKIGRRGQREKQNADKSVLAWYMLARRKLIWQLIIPPVRMKEGSVNTGNNMVYTPSTPPRVPHRPDSFRCFTGIRVSSRDSKLENSAIFDLV